MPISLFLSQESLGHGVEGAGISPEGEGEMGELWNLWPGGKDSGFLHHQKTAFKEQLAQEARLRTSLFPPVKWV